ncbi:hypothetical protein MPSEU_000413600 [Mayamaea pseudoterrestris]|nr:hypothetical protein MPSEU_000413600 [Mayamaea pseudoterrestris]
MFRGTRTLNQRLSSKASDVYSSDETDEEHDIASALAEAQRYRYKSASARNLNAAAMRAMREMPQQSDSFSTQDDVELQILDDVATRKNVFRDFGRNVNSNDVIDQAAFSSSGRTSPKRVIVMPPVVTPPSKQSSRVRSPVAEEELDGGHDSFDFSVVQFSPQHQKKTTLGNHFAATTMSQSDLIHEGEGEEELSIAEFSGQWQTMRQEGTARNNALPSPPITPSNVRSGVLRQSSYDTPPGTPVTKTILDSPTKRAHTTGTRKKRAIRLKASALGLDDGATVLSMDENPNRSGSGDVTKTVTFK